MDSKGLVFRHSDGIVPKSTHPSSRWYLKGREPNLPISRQLFACNALPLRFGKPDACSWMQSAKSHLHFYALRMG